MSNNYVHSETFASLKTVKEELDQNYTTYQLLSTLDHFIESAIDPIVSAYPALTDVYFAKVIAYQFLNPNTKCSRNEKDKLPPLLFNALTTHGKRKREYQKKMLLNRGLLFGLVSVFMKTVNTYRKLHDHNLKLPRSTRLMLMRVAEQRVGSSFLYPAIVECEYQIKKAYKFKELIVQKYVRMSLNQARKTYLETDCTQKLNDIIQIYLIYLSKAIERCDSRQGVLTPYIKNWFYSAKSEIMKTAVKEGLNTSYDQLMESGVDAQTVGPDSHFEAIQHLAHVARKLDPTGAYRYALQIPESYSSQDLRRLSLFTTENN